MTQTQIRRYFRNGSLTQLRTFEAVARHASFTRAAEELCLSQPTVSVHIKKLTQALGLALFKQTGMRIELTAAGRELRAGCVDILQILSLVEEKIAPLRKIKPEHERGRTAGNVSAEAKRLA